MLIELLLIIASPPATVTATTATSTAATMAWHLEETAAYRGAAAPPPKPPEALDGRRPAPNLGRPPQRRPWPYHLLWGPRALFYPAHLAAEYGVRTPLEWATEGFEKHRLLEYYKHYTGWDEGRAQVYPLLRKERGFYFAVGAALLWNEIDNGPLSATLVGDTNFRQNLTGDARLSWATKPNGLNLSIGAKIERRSDFVFYGVGPDTEQSDETRFFRNKQMLYLLGEGPLSSWVDTRFQVELSHNGFGCSPGFRQDICGPDARSATGDERHPMTPGAALAEFASGYPLFRIKAEIAADTRRERPRSGSGVRTEFFARVGQGVGRGAGDIRFLRFGTEFAAFWDVLEGYQRVLGFRLRTEQLEALGHGARVPFAELITGGGNEFMRGFVRARFHGRSMMAATVDYRYPVWSMLDGTLFYELGNAFDAGFGGFRPARLRSSFGIGLRTSTSRRFAVDMLIAFGTTRFNDPNYRVDRFRFVFGTTWGF